MLTWARGMGEGGPPPHLVAQWPQRQPSSVTGSHLQFQRQLLYQRLVSASVNGGLSTSPELCFQLIKREQGRVGYFSFWWSLEDQVSINELEKLSGMHSPSPPGKGVRVKTEGESWSPQRTTQNSAGIGQPSSQAGGHQSRRDRRHGLPPPLPQVLRSSASPPRLSCPTEENDSSPGSH